MNNKLCYAGAVLVVLILALTKPTSTPDVSGLTDRRKGHTTKIIFPRMPVPPAKPASMKEPAQADTLVNR